MRLDKKKKVIICNGIEYPPTAHNAGLYMLWLLTKDKATRKEIKKQLSQVVLDI